MDELDDSIAWPNVDPVKRLALWRTLLGYGSQPAHAENSQQFPLPLCRVDATSSQLMNSRIENVVQDLPNQRVIRVDADRVGPAATKHTAWLLHSCILCRPGRPISFSRLKPCEKGFAES